MNNMYLSHHGILGQKWGVRRYQNADGTLTEAGRKRYERQIKKAEDTRRVQQQQARTFNGVSRNMHNKRVEIFDKELRNTDEYKVFAKAQSALEEYEMDIVNNNKPYDEKAIAKNIKMQKDLDRKAAVYQKKINEVYAKHENELLSARLNDLNLPDDDTWRDVYKKYHKDKVSRLGYDMDSYLQLFMS